MDLNSPRRVQDGTPPLWTPGSLRRMGTKSVEEVLVSRRMQHTHAAHLGMGPLTNPPKAAPKRRTEDPELVAASRAVASLKKQHWGWMTGRDSQQPGMPAGNLPRAAQRQILVAAGQMTEDLGDRLQRLEESLL
mmetsp:Transcript_22151/g.68936  ORF Transcript_22151/g.68936 Transcript_22151/m.68936 type:complete len:134 (+) Transcript_22151:33-434(+)